MKAKFVPRESLQYLKQRWFFTYYNLLTQCALQEKVISVHTYYMLQIGIALKIGT